MLKTRYLLLSFIGLSIIPLLQGMNTIKRINELSASAQLAVSIQLKKDIMNNIQDYRESDISLAQTIDEKVKNRLKKESKGLTALLVEINDILQQCKEKNTILQRFLDISEPGSLTYEHAESELFYISLASLPIEKAITMIEDKLPGIDGLIELYLKATH